MDTLAQRRLALGEMRGLLERFIRCEIEPRDFIPAYRQLFAPFDPPDLSTGGLSAEEKTELKLFVLLMGGWFGEYEEEIPKRQDWKYGSDLEPYSWIDGPAYRQWVLKAAEESGIRL